MAWQVRGRPCSGSDPLLGDGMHGAAKHALLPSPALVKEAIHVASADLPACLRGLRLPPLLVPHMRVLIMHTVGLRSSPSPRPALHGGGSPTNTTAAAAGRPGGRSSLEELRQHGIHVEHPRPRGRLLAQQAPGRRFLDRGRGRHGARPGCCQHLCVSSHLGSRKGRGGRRGG